MSEHKITQPRKSRVWRKALSADKFYDTGRPFQISELHPNIWLQSTSGVTLSFNAESGGKNGGMTNFAIIIPPSEFQILIEAMHRKNPQAVISTLQKLSVLGDISEPGG